MSDIIPIERRFPDPIHKFAMGFGGEKWIEARYIHDLTPGAAAPFRWVFNRGGEMFPSDWPEVIANGLAYVGRFGGLPYSVGRHSNLLRDYLRIQGASPATQLAAQLHDASERLGVGDINAHLKKLIGDKVRPYEDAVFQFLLDDLLLTPYLTDMDLELVHKTDKMFGETEARLLNMRNGEAWRVPEGGEAWDFLGQILFDERPQDTIAGFLDRWAESSRELTDQIQSRMPPF